MPDYRRAWSPGGTYFFTLVTHQRRPILIEPHARQLLRQAFLRAKQQAGPFQRGRPLPPARPSALHLDPAGGRLRLCHPLEDHQSPLAAVAASRLK